MILNNGQVYLEPGQGGVPFAGATWKVGETWEQYAKRAEELGAKIPTMTETAIPSSSNLHYAGTLATPSAEQLAPKSNDTSGNIFLIIGILAGGFVLLELTRLLLRVFRP